MRFVILPQTIRLILPALGNQLVYMLKMSSLVSVIGMQELTRKANELVVSAFVRWLGRRMQAYERD